MMAFRLEVKLGLQGANTHRRFKNAVSTMLPVDMTTQDAPMPGGADREALANMLNSYAPTN